MGLLDYDALMTNPLLQAGLGILANNNSRNAGQVIGAGLQQGFGNVAQYQNMMQRRKQQEQENQMRQQQFDMQKTQFDQAQSQAKQRQDLLSRLPQTLGVNPDVLAAYPELGQKLVETSMFPKPSKIGFAPNGVAYDENNPNLEIGKSYAKAEDALQNPNKPFMIVDGKVVPNKAYQDYEINKARAGASNNNVSVNTGQKGFDNTLKLRGDFRSEPIYKAHQDVKSAYSQISSALKQASPAGDLAGATKLMKILDPGSVVRESELGMAMAATGALDRLYNYADMVTKGTKLTPAQRKDFQNLADKLYVESANQYNAKRGEYKGIADRNELNVVDVVGNEELTQQNPTVKTRKYNPKTGRIE